MVRIPIYDNQRPLNTGSDFFRAPADTSRPISAGIGTISDGLVAIGGAIEARDKRLDALSAEKEILDLEKRTNENVRAARENIPENGTGFHTSVMKGVMEDAEQTLGRIPEQLRPQYEVRLKGWLNSQSEQTAGIEAAQTKKFVSTVTQQKITTLTDNVVRGLMTKDRAVEDVDGFLGGLGLPPERNVEMRRALVRGIESAAMEHLRATNPQEFFRQAQRYMPNSPSDRAPPGSVQSTIIEQSNAAGVDPRLLLTIGNIESSFRPNTTASKTIAGVFQMTADTRRRFGIPEDRKFDVALGAAAMARLVQEAEQRMIANGVEVTPSRIWGYHFLGAGGLMRFMKADPNADAYETYALAAGANIANQAFNGSNKGLLDRGMTVGQVLSAIDRRFAAKEKEVDQYLKQNPSVDPAAPVSILGQTFSELKAGDLATHYTKARDVTNRITGTAFELASKDAVQQGAVPINRHDPVFRKRLDDAAETDEAQIKLLRGDVDTFAKYANQARAGYLPRDAARAGLAMLDSTDGSTKSRGYELLGAAYASGEKAGLTYSGVTGEYADKVRDYVALTVHGGFNSKEAIQRIEMTRSPEFKLKEGDLKSRVEQSVRNRSFAEIESSLNLKQGFGNRITSAIGITNPSGAEPVPDAIKRRMEERYQQHFRFHMLAGNGDVETSKANALMDLKKSHNFTRVIGDQPYLMPYPPERNYPAEVPLKDGEDPSTLSKQRFQESFGYITKQALESANLAAKALKDARAGKLTVNDLQLIPTGQTRRDVEVGELPRYELYFRSRDGWRLVTPEFRADPSAAAVARDAPGTAGGRAQLSGDAANRVERFRAKNAADK